jgi:hypothetical protein
VNASIQRAEAIVDALRLTNHELKSITSMIASYRVVLDQSDWSELELHRFWYPLQEKGIDAILLAIADYLGTYGAELEQADWLVIVERVTILLDTYFNRFDDVVSPALLLDGHDVMEMLEIRGGPQVGKLLTALREAQVVGDITTVEDARAFVLACYQDMQNS